MKKLLLLLVVLLLTFFVVNQCTGFNRFERGDRIYFGYKETPKRKLEVFGGGDEKIWFWRKPSSHFWERKKGSGFDFRVITHDGRGDIFAARKIVWIKKHPEQLPMPKPIRRGRR